MDEEGLGMTQAGWICGIIGTILNGPDRAVVRRVHRRHARRAKARRGCGPSSRGFAPPAAAGGPTAQG